MTLIELLKPIEQRLRAVTPGPWKVRCPSFIDSHTSPSRVWSNYGWVAVTEFLPRDHAVPNAEFIANAPTDIEKLLAALKVADEALDKVAKNRFSDDPVDIKQLHKIAAHAQSEISAILRGEK